MNRNQLLENRIIAFAIDANKLSANLFNNEHSKYFAKQLIRSSGSSALNYAEARGAESKKDFIHKIKVSLKELRETNANLNIIKGLDFGNKVEIENLINENKELIAIMVTIVKNTQFS